MTKFLVLICILVGLAVADDTCLYTANIKSFYGFSDATVAMTAPKAYSDLKYCTSLKSGACCTDTDINSIGSLSDEYTKNLTTLVSTRDTYITTVKNTVLPTLLTNIQNFNQVATKFLTTFEQEMGSALAELSDIDVSDVDVDESDMDVDESDMDIDESDLDLDESDLDALSGASLVLGMVEAFGYITNITTEFAANVDSIKSNYVNYQNARRTCVLDMIDVQNSALCLSCDPEAATKGFVDFAIALAEAEAEMGTDVEDDTEDDDTEDEDESDEDDSDEEEYDGVALTFGIAMSDATCERLQTSCKPYIALAVGQNQLIEVTSASAAFTGLTTAMQSFIDGKYDEAMTEIFAVLNTTDSATDDVPALIDGQLPYGCDTNGECEWVCSGLFVSGFVDPTALLVGGEYGDDIEGEDDEEDDDEDEGGVRRLLAEKRRLADSADGTWAPAKGDSGVTVTFAADPAGTNNSKKFGSLNLGNVFVGMMVVISSILLF